MGFQAKMAGGSNDPDDLIVRAFKAYETDGKIEAEMFRHALMNFGDKFNQAEIDDIFGEFEVDDDGFLESKAVIGLFVAGGGEEKKEARRKRRRRRLPSKWNQLDRFLFIFFKPPYKYRCKHGYNNVRKGCSTKITDG